MMQTIKQQKYGSIMRWGLLLVLMALVLPLIPYAISASADKVTDATYQAKVANPGAGLWRDVRQRDGAVAGNTQMQNMNAGELINRQGQEWREYRMQKLVPYSAYLIGIVLLAIGTFWFTRGTIKIEAGRSGRKVERFSLNQRTVHWIVAGMFVLLGLTGLVLLYGRFVLIPVLGSSGFGITAQVAKTIHDFVGPAFGIALIAQFFLFVRGNAFNMKVDMEWLKRGGGLFGKHASAECYNAGEKIWFWIAMLGGAVIIVTGVILDFPFFNQDRAMLEFNHMIHTIVAVIVLAIAFGHIYMGTAAMEGAFESMATGYCDENWAKEHHDIWYKNMQARQPGATSEGAVAGSEETT